MRMTFTLGLTLVSLSFPAVVGAQPSPSPSPSLSPSDELIEVVHIGERPTLEGVRKYLNLERAKALLATPGIDLRRTNPAGATALHMALGSYTGLPSDDVDHPKYVELIRLLIQKGADLRQKTHRQRDALYTLIFEVTHKREAYIPNVDASAILTYMLADQLARLDLNSTDFRGLTVLQTAIEFRGYEEARQLIAAGASLEGQDLTGRNIVAAAIVAGELRYLDLIAAHTTPALLAQLVAQKTKAGSTSLLVAVFEGRYEAANWLLDRTQIDVNATNSDGYNAVRMLDKRLASGFYSGPIREQVRALRERLVAMGGVSSAPPAQPAIECQSNYRGEITLESLRKLIDTCKIKQVEGLLKVLPRSFLGSYNLVYRGRGLIGATPAYPSVILSSIDGNILLAFGGHPSLPGYQNLDFIEKRSNPERFELRAIEFGGGKAKISAANPKQCTQCHGARPKPLFDGWFMWPGVYGSEQDAMFPKEKELYEKEFLPNSKQGRYRFLLDRGDTPAISNLGEFNAGVFVNFALNFKMNHLTSEVQMDRIARSAELKPLRFAMLAALSCQEPIADFLSAKEKAKRAATSEEKALLDVRKLSREELVRRGKLQGEFLPGSPQGDYWQEVLSSPDVYEGFGVDTKRIARLRYLLTSTSFKPDWYTGFDAKSSNRYAEIAFDLKNYEINLWRRLLRPAIASEKPAYDAFEARWRQLGPEATSHPGLFRGVDFRPVIAGVDSAPVCAKLKALSLAATQ